MRRYLQATSLMKISKKTSPRLEISKHLLSGKPTILEDIEGYPNMRIVGNLCCSRDDVARALNTTKEKLIPTFLEALEAPTPYSVVASAVFLKNKIYKPNVIEHIPLLVFYEPENEALERRYTSATVVLARDPDSGRENASFHRMMYLGKNRFAIRLVPRDLHDFHQRNKEKRKDTKVVIICGIHPAISLAASTSHPGLNELELANTFLGGDLECVSLDGIDVPTSSEVVMTGRILHNQTAEEGPFVDLTGTWDIIREQPVVEIKNIYMKKDPIWQVILSGGAEHRLLMGLPQEPRMFRVIQNTVPTVRKVTLTEGGCCWLHAVISIRKRVEGDGKNAGLAALAAHPSLKRVIIVDEDIDPEDPVSVEWALATRLRPTEGVTLISGARGSSLDPSTTKTGTTTKWIIDATVPLDRDKGEFMRVDRPT